MTLLKKMIICLLFSSFLTGSICSYFWIIKEEEYFPDNYETAFGWVGNAILFCIFLVFIVFMHHRNLPKKMRGGKGDR